VANDAIHEPEAEQMLLLSLTVDAIKEVRVPIPRGVCARRRCQGERVAAGGVLGKIALKIQWPTCGLD
jgi:hypothetical protein